MCAYCETNDLFRGYSECLGGEDYLEIMELFLNRASEQFVRTRDEIALVTVPLTPILAEQCFRNDYAKSIDGKVVAMKAETFLPKYRTADHQLVLVDGGFGAQGNARDSAVFGYNLYSGKHARYERRDVLGEVIPEHIPPWAAERAKAIQERIRRRPEPER